MFSVFVDFLQKFMIHFHILKVLTSIKWILI